MELIRKQFRPCRELLGLYIMVEQVQKKQIESCGLFNKRFKKKVGDYIIYKWVKPYCKSVKNVFLQTSFIVMDTFQNSCNVLGDTVMTLYKEKKKHRGPVPLLERQSSINNRKRSFTIILIILIITLRISFLNAQKSFFNIDKMIFCLQKLSVSPSIMSEGEVMIIRRGVYF